MGAWYGFHMKDPVMDALLLIISFIEALLLLFNVVPNGTLRFPGRIQKVNI